MEKPIPLSTQLKQRILKKVVETRKQSVVQLLFNAGLGCIDQILGSGNIVHLNPLTVRGTQKAAAYRVNLGEVEVDISPDQIKDGTYDIWLKAFSKKESIYRCEWQLWKGRSLFEQQPSETGEGLFTKIPGGVYQLVLFIAGQEVGVIDITLGEDKFDE